jgi:steroid 5-alpha reductase family enzyme
MQLYFQALLLILTIMTILWIVSIFLKNVSIVDLFWGIGFVIVNIFYFLKTEAFTSRPILLLLLVTIWGLRLSFYLAWRNVGKGEDFRYREFRKKYGENNYWWISLFQTFLLQGILMWIISLPLFGVNLFSHCENLSFIDYLGIFVWIIGFIFEAGGDYQLAKFKLITSNKGKVLNTGLWKYTRHPNYFGDAAVWWGYGILCLAAGGYLYILGSFIMTLLLIKVSGVVLLEKTLKDQKPEYLDYIQNTNSFFPWFPKNKR